jgi:hypothetical protein
MDIDVLSGLATLVKELLRSHETIIAGVEKSLASIRRMMDTTRARG